MKNFIKKFIILLPFTVLLTFNIIAEKFGFDLQITKIALAITSFICLASLGITFILKIFSYTSIGFTIYCIFLSIMSFIKTDLMLFMAKNTALGIFLTIFLLSFFSLFTNYPYAAEFGRMIRPVSVWSTKAFIKSNIVLTIIWLIISALCSTIAILPGSYIIDKHRAIFYGSSFIVGILLNIIVIKIFRKKYNKDTKEFIFNYPTVREMLKNSPKRFNKNAAKGEHIIYQYHISGTENFECFIEIKDQICAYHDGIHSKPTCEIYTEADSWKDIYSGRISGVKAYFKGLYKIKGDLSALQKLSLLIPTIKNYEEKSSLDDNTILIPEKYEKLSTSNVKNIIVLDGGPRGESHSKTTMVTKAFCSGASASGAKVNYIFLKNKNIKPCMGCFHCWTKVPGKCIIDDDMSEINELIKKSDVIILATPLYRYGYSSPLKACLDRTLPLLKPYIIDHNNMLVHPVRYQDTKKEQGIIVFSCSAFPELEIFKGLSQCLHTLVNHSTVFKFMAEFYIVAGESLSLPFYKDRKENILKICQKAGKELIAKGKVSFEDMKMISEYSYSPEIFKERGNSFWETIEYKNEYYDVMPKNQ